MKEITKNDALTLGSPYPYVLAAVMDDKAKPSAIGLAWWTFVSWEPTMIAISVGRGKHAHQCITNRGEFVLCFPSEEQAKGAWLCGTKSGYDVDKIKLAGFKMTPSTKIETPTIEGSTVAYECKVVNKLETGDHTLFIANVAGITGDPMKKMHLASIHYTKLIAYDCEGNVNMHLQFT